MSTSTYWTRDPSKPSPFGDGDMSEYYRMLKDPAYMAKKEAEMWARNDPDGRIRAQFAKEKPTKKSATRKKPKQKKMDKAFAPKTNWQGFEMKFCVYQTSVSDFVYVPRNYAKNTAVIGLQTLTSLVLLSRSYCLKQSNISGCSC